MINSIYLPTSKSIANRWILMAAMSRSKVTFGSVVLNDDITYMVESLKVLGFDIEYQNQKLVIQGMGGDIPEKKATLHVGNAGTVIRFLIPILVLKKGGVYTLKGAFLDKKRPIEHLLDVLKRLGALDYQLGNGELTLYCLGTEGGVVQVDTTVSSQYVSGLCMLGGLLEKGLDIHCVGMAVSEPFIGMTLGLMERIGIQFTKNDNCIRLQGGQKYSFEQTIHTMPGDVTAASYWVSWVIMHQRPLCLLNLPRNCLQADALFFEVMSGYIDLEWVGEKLYLYPGTIQKAIDADFKPISDTFLSLAALAPLLPYPTTIRGIGHTRYQECNRIEAVYAQLTNLGQTVEVSEDSLRITPNKQALLKLTRQHPIMIETYADHRIAMSFGVLASHDLHGDKRAWLSIKNPECSLKSYPLFFEQLNNLYV